MADEGQRKTRTSRVSGWAGGAVYFLGAIGALVYYIQQAEGLWPTVLGVLKGLVWPAYLVYDLLKFLSS